MACVGYEFVLTLHNPNRCFEDGTTAVTKTLTGLYARLLPYYPRALDFFDVTLAVGNCMLLRSNGPKAIRTTNNKYNST